MLARSGHRLCLPRVHAACEYQAPLFFEDEVRIQLLVEKKSPRSLAYQFRFFRLNGDPVKEIARGRLVVVCAERREDGSLHPATLPSALAGQIQVASPEILASPLRPAKPKPQLAA